MRHEATEGCLRRRQQEKVPFGQVKNDAAADECAQGRGPDNEVVTMVGIDCAKEHVCICGIRINEETQFDML